MTTGNPPIHQCGTPVAHVRTLLFQKLLIRTCIAASEAGRNLQIWTVWITGAEWIKRHIHENVRL